MTAAADLFKANKFAEALAAFQQLPADDARVLYYTALATGFSTNKWEATGDAATLAAKAQQAEKAGTPAKADIDAAFAGLKETQGKKWLDFYRGSIK